jgi:uncharacterized protein YeeX (DUF496 family)
MSDSKDNKTVTKYGVLMYDVPTHMRKLYQKIRKATGPKSLMQTWSCYLFPWALRDQLEADLEEINEDLKSSDRIQYRLLLMDPSQEEIHEQMVYESINNMLKAMRDTLQKRIIRAREAVMDAEAAKEAPKETMEKARRIACRKASKRIEEAQKLALLFGQEGVLEDAFDAYTKVIKAEGELGDFLTRDAYEEAQKNTKDDDVDPSQEDADFEKKMAHAE